MTTSNDNLEHELKKFYAHVPSPPGGLAAGRERMLAEAGRLKAQAASHPLSAGHSAAIQKPQRRRKMKFVLAYKIITVVTAIVLGTTAAGGGVALAANDSLPGDALYPVKLFAEDVRLALTVDPAAQARLSLAFAAQRGEEMQQLMARSEPVPEEAIARMARYTEQVMAQVAQAQPEDVPGLLERVMERTRAQEQVLEQVRARAPEETQPALRRALEEMKRAYETASAAQGDAQRFQKEYQRRYEATPGPHGEASPAHPLTLPCENCTPEREQNQGREQDRNGTASPVGTPQPYQDRNREHDATATLEPDREREQNQNQNQAVTPVGTMQQDRDRDRDRAQEQTPTPEPTLTPAPTPIPEPTSPANQGPCCPTHMPMPSHTPKHGGQGGGH
jgi:hypothetical protein